MTHTLPERIIQTARDHLLRWEQRTPAERQAQRLAYWHYLFDPGMPLGNWCACFVSRILGDAAGDHRRWPRSAGARQLARRLEAAGWRTREPHEIPRPGDVVLFWRGSPTDWRGHIGFVELASPQSITTIEGNSGNAVRRRTYTARPDLVPRVLGYLAPPEATP